MDMMFFIGVNIALLGLLVYGLMTAKEKIKACLLYTSDAADE